MSVPESSSSSSSNNNNTNIRPHQYATDLEWLLETSGKFTTEFSKSFLLRTNLRLDFVRLCVQCAFHQIDARTRKIYGVSKELQQLQNTIRQKYTLQTRTEILRLVRKERGILKEKKTTLLEMIQNNHIQCKAAKRLVDWLGPTYWKSFLTQRWSDDVGICPHCQMLIFKNQGCKKMICFCGHAFHWPDVEIDRMTIIAELRSHDKTLIQQPCSRINSNSNNKNNNNNKYSTKRAYSETVFHRRWLQAAEQLLVSAIAVGVQKKRRKKSRQRPLLQTEELDDIVESIAGYNYNNSFHRRAAAFYYLSLVNSEALDENEHNNDDPIVRCDAPTHEGNSFSLIEMDDDELSSVYTTVSSSPPEILSLCDFSIVSNSLNQDVVDGTSHCQSALPFSNKDKDWVDEENCSYSVLSGCETVYSLDDLSEERDGKIATITTMMSFSNAVKLGISIAKKVEEPRLSPMKGTTATVVEKQRNASESKKAFEKSSTDSSLLLSACHKNATVCNNQEGNDSPNNYDDNDDDDDDDDDDVFLFMYDAAKSGHGGRASLRFKGCRTTPKLGWGRHRRPHWSRKRRKEYKNHAYVLVHY